MVPVLQISRLPFKLAVHGKLIVDAWQKGDPQALKNGSSTTDGAAY